MSVVVASMSSPAPSSQPPSTKLSSSSSNELAEKIEVRLEDETICLNK